LEPPPSLFAGDLELRTDDDVGPWPAEPHSRFFERMHVDELHTTVPWAGSGGAPTVVAVAGTRADARPGSALGATVGTLHAAGSSGAAHLVLVDEAHFEPPAGDGFDTVTPLGGADADSVTAALVALMSSADAVLHAGTRRGLDLLERMPRELRGPHLSLDHVDPGAGSSLIARKLLAGEAGDDSLEIAA
jgi:hypothetical protein